MLRNYGAGIVLVPAESAEQAWALLKAQQPGVWTTLQFDQRSFLDETATPADLEQWIELEAPTHPPGFPLPPEEFSVDQLPILVQWGSD